MSITYSIGSDMSRFPEVVAFADGDEIACIWTSVEDDMVMAHMSEIRCQSPGAVMLSLVEIYEHLLLHAGIRNYWFWVDGSNNAMLRCVKAMNGRYVKLAESSGNILFQAELEAA
jgi:hypothetical protein